MAERAPLAAGDVGGGVGRQRLGVDGDRKARLLDEPRGGQPHHAGAEHRDRALMALQAEQGGELRRAPGQGDAGAAMAVIVDEALVAQRLGADDEAGGAIGAEARRRCGSPARARPCTGGRQPVRRGAVPRRVVVAQPGRARVAAAEPRKARRSMAART